MPLRLIVHLFSPFVVTVDGALGHEPELFSVAIYADKLSRG